VLPAEFAGGWHFAPEAVGLRSERRRFSTVYSPWVVYPRRKRFATIRPWLPINA